MGTKGLRSAISQGSTHRITTILSQISDSLITGIQLYELMWRRRTAEDYMKHKLRHFPAFYRQNTELNNQGTTQVDFTSACIVHFIKH